MSSVLQGAQFMLFAADNGYGVLLVILCSSAIALLYNVVHALLIKQTSAVTVTVLGQLKVVGLIVVSAIVLGKSSLCHFLQPNLANKIVCTTASDYAVEVCSADGNVQSTSQCNS